MIKTLIIDDADFFGIQEILSRNQNIQILNDGNISYDEINSLLDSHYKKEGFDLVIMDLRMPNVEQNGLRALNAWIIRSNLDAQSLNFGIIAVTRYGPEEVNNALGKYLEHFGNSFLGLVLKDNDNFSINLERLISNAFITPPFVRGGDKYFNTRLLRDKFSMFEKSITIKNNSIPFHKIIAVQQSSDGVLAVYTTEEILYDTVYIDDKPISNSEFFKNFCYDASVVKNDTKDYKIDNLPWTKDIKSTEDEKIKNEMLKNKKNAENNIKKTGESRILKYIENSFPVFVCVGTYFAINPLFLKNTTDIKPKKKTIEKVVKDLNLYNNSSLEIRGNISLEFIMIKKNEKKSDVYIPVYGRLLESSGKCLDKVKKEDGNLEEKEMLRIRNDYYDRWFLFTEITSERWQPLLKQLKRYYSQP